MLVLSRKVGGKIIVRPIDTCPHCGKRVSDEDQTIIVTAIEIRSRNNLRLGIQAPMTTNIVREEIDTLQT